MSKKDTFNGSITCTLSTHVGLRWSRKTTLSSSLEALNLTCNTITHSVAVQGHNPHCTRNSLLPDLHESVTKTTTAHHFTSIILTSSTFSRSSRGSSSSASSKSPSSKLSNNTTQRPEIDARAYQNQLLYTLQVYHDLMYTTVYIS